MARTLTQDLEVILFYPETSDVRTQLDQYFQALAQKEPRVKVTRLDKDLAPARAEELKVPRNGIVLLKYGEKNERIDTGTQLTKARSTLKKLDSEFQKKFLVLTARQRTAYFTKGHGEATWLSQEGEGSAEKSIQGLEAILRAQNYNIRQFGLAEGSATEVPPEVNVVVIVGHTRAFQQEEIDALKRFLDRGGSLMVFFDSNTADDTSAQLAFNPEGDALKEFLSKDIGINFNAAPLANEREHVNANRGEADRWFTITNIFTSHESVATLARHDERVALMLLRAGSLVVAPSTGEWQAMETVRSLASTFADQNANFKFDEGQEKRDSYSIGAVATREVKVNGESKQAKVFAFADATLVSDLLIRYPQMQILFNDSIKWLVGDLEFGGDVSNEEDVKIIHTKKKNLVWFWGSIFVVPAFVMLVGWVATRSIGQGRGRKMKDLDDAV